MDKIIFDNVGLSFASNVIFKNCSRELKSARVIGIVGRNGSGKSTFLKLAGKILKPDDGQVNFFDGKILTASECTGKVAAITPEMKVYDALTVEENLNFFAKLRGKNFSGEDLLNLSEKVGLDFQQCGKARAGNLSTGMRQRLKFAILLSVDAEICLLDEPTANLDDDGKKIFHNEIQNSAQIGKIILLATNDVSDLRICDEIITLPLD